MRYCPRCKSKKPLEDFWKSRTAPSGTVPYCKPCSRTYRQEHFTDEQRRRYGVMTRNGRLLRVYGITADQYSLIIEKQAGGCGICGKTKEKKKSLAVDHCKSTNVIRGILCENCNRAIGLLNHDINLLHKASIYLSRDPIDLF